MQLPFRIWLRGSLVTQRIIPSEESKRYGESSNITPVFQYIITIEYSEVISCQVGTGVGQSDGRICFLQIQSARNISPIRAGMPAINTYTLQSNPRAVAIYQDAQPRNMVAPTHSQRQARATAIANTMGMELGV